MLRKRGLFEVWWGRVVENMKQYRGTAWALGALGAVCTALLFSGCTRPRITWTDILYAEDQGNLDARHDAVVQLAGGCSGTLIAANRVLTAAHCVARPGDYPVVYIGDRDLASGAAFETTRCYLHPLAYDEPAECGVAPPGPVVRRHDLAILYLANEVPPTLARPHSPLLFSPTPRTAWIRQPVRLVGWHRWPQRLGRVRRYTGIQEITAFGDGLLITQPGDDARVFATRQGDSGGPALIEIGNDPTVVGVLSGGSGLGHLGPRFSVYTPTFETTNASWVRAHLQTMPQSLASR